MQRMRREVKIFLACLATLAVLAAVMVAALPRTGGVAYRYTIGSPWTYDRLTAEYNFPVRKSSATIAQERDSVMRDYRPYLVMRDSVLVVEAEAELSGEQAAQVDEVLADAARLGMVEQELYMQLIDSGLTECRVVEGVRARTVSTTDLMTPRKLSEQLTSSVEGLNENTVSEIVEAVKPNLELDIERTEALKKDLMQSVSLMLGMVQKGEKIIDRGEIVTEERAQVIESLRLEQARQGTADVWTRSVGQWVYIFLLMLLFLLSMSRLKPGYLRRTRLLGLIWVLIAAFSILATLVEQWTSWSALCVPFAMVPLFIRIFFDSRTAYVGFFVTILIAALGVAEPWALISTQFVAGMIGIYSIRQLRERSQIVRCAGWITLGTWLILLAYDLSSGAVPSLSLNRQEWTLGSLALRPYLEVFVAGVLLLFAYPLMYLIERLTGCTSSVTLIEISNINTPLLRRLSKEAPGTFNHSMQVANLAGAIADRIGANVELVRTGALYHDIGKLRNPAFFTENQLGRNPHETLPEHKSAQIIINHVKDGLDLAREYGLPREIRDFIATHHGRSRAQYFYVQYVNKHPGEPVNEELFTYPGPNPETKEQAILMMADSVEAASRSLKEVTDESLRELVERIVGNQMQAGYFRRCPLTFRDVEDAKDELEQSLRTVYHTRVEYPKLRGEQ